ncbi:ArsC/Spx/MgsR family protein [Azotobacter chroococcum]
MWRQPPPENPAPGAWCRTGSPGSAEHPWTREQLEAFFAGLEKDAMVNSAAPKIKSGELDVAALSRDELIGKMLAEPLLIKRPLLEVGETRICGFDIPRLNALLEVDMPVPETINSCLKTDKCSSH